MMKKLISLLSISSWVIPAAQDEAESIGSQMAEAVSGMQAAANEVMSSMSYKMKIMLFWASMSSMHKLIIVGLGVLVVFWILCKLMHHRKGSCSCGCGASGCGCHRR